MTTWTITYDDGDQLRETEATGKLSLDATWAFVLAPGPEGSTISLAIPSQRIVLIESAP